MIRAPYRGYDSYFEDLAAERRDLDYYRVVQAGMAGGTVRAHFFPRAGEQGTNDPIEEALDRVRCARGTAIRIGMSEWDAYRMSLAPFLRDQGVVPFHGEIRECADLFRTPSRHGRSARWG